MPLLVSGMKLPSICMVSCGSRSTARTRNRCARWELLHTQ
jgi:hypothetical protein